MTDQYKCQSYYDDNNVVQECTCGKCGDNIEKRVDEFSNKFSMHGNYLSGDCDLKEATDWLTQALKETREETLREVVEWCEDNKIVETDGHPFCFTEADCETNDALNEIQHHLKTLLDSSKEDEN